MNIYEHRRPARVGKKDVHINEHYDNTIHMVNKLKCKKHYLIIGALALAVVFIEGFIVGKLMD